MKNSDLLYNVVYGVASGDTEAAKKSYDQYFANVAKEIMARKDAERAQRNAPKETVETK